MASGCIAMVTDYLFLPPGSSGEMPGGRAPPACMMPYLHQHVLEAGTKEVCGRASGTALHATPFPKEGETANEAKENTAKPWRTTRSALIRPRTQSMLSFISCYHQVCFK